jgi:threo-3-hydroxy-L-aspartate ammonia-lyase
MAPVAIDEVYEARERIHGVAVLTPLIETAGLEIPAGNELRLKTENFQRTWSFKLRGAYNAVSSLSVEERSRGVITYSSGNHGQAVACAASLLDIQAVIVMPEDAIAIKVEMTRKYGAEVVFAGHTSLDRQQRAMELIEEHGYVVIPPFDDRRIIAGQGTAGLEIVEQWPEVEAVVVPVGGGGLLSGVATAVKALRPDVRVIGVEPDGAADARDSWTGGSITTWDSVDTVADGLRTSRVGELNFATMRELVDDIVTVSDLEILTAVRTLVNGAKLVAEPSGAVAPAAVLTGKTGLRNTRVVAIISGGNIDPVRLRSCLEPDSSSQDVAAPG